MKKHLQFIGIFTLVISLAFASCDKKDDDNDNPSKSTSEYLTAGNWKITAMTIDPGIDIGGLVITDFFTMTPACSKDDLTRFNSNGTITDDEGPTKCDQNDPQTTTEGTWVLSADNKTLTITDPEEAPIDLTIVSINDSSFTGTYTLEEDFGTGLMTYTITVSMTRV